MGERATAGGFRRASQTAGLYAGRSFQPFGDHLGNAKSAFAAEPLCERLTGEVAKLVMTGILVLVGILARHGAKRLLRLVEPMAHQEAFEVARGLFDLCRIALESRLGGVLPGWL